METWYASKGSMGQGMVACEKTGRTVAVAYDEKDTNLLASGPKLLKACKLALCVLNGMTTENFRLGRDRKIRQRLERVIYEVENGE